MNDVFVSYKAEDRARIAPLVAALEADGLSVWWDAHIGGGSDWRESIQEHLDAARCVIVAWSVRSTASEGRFVRDEASRAQRRGVYLPVRIDPVEPPLGFGETQALELVGWRGDKKDARYQALLAAARAIVDGATSPVPGSAPARPGQRLLDRRGLIAGGAVAAVGVAAVGGWAAWRRLGSTGDDRSIAVLPFANLSGDPAQAYFADGLAEELRSALARLGELKVIARASCEAVRDAPVTEAARKLGVATVLTGSVRRSPTLIRVTAQLVNGSDGVERWSETYDRAPGDALQIQSGIAENVAGALRIHLGEAQKAALTAGGTRNAAAQDLLLQATELGVTASGEAEQRKILSLFEAAIALDPNYADAHARRASAMVNIAGTYSTAEKAAPIYVQAEAGARHAIELAPRSPSGYLALANVMELRLQLREAARQYQRAAELAGDNGRMLRNYASFLAAIGHSDEAAKTAERAIVVDPLNVSSRLTQVEVLYFSGRTAEAEAAARHVLSSRPDLKQPHMLLGLCLLQQGRLADARAELDKAAQDHPQAQTAQVVVARRLGDAASAQKFLAQLRQTYGDSASYQYAQIHAQLGETEQAFAALDRAWEIRDPGLESLRVDPLMSPLRNDRRYAALVQKLDFP